MNNITNITKLTTTTTSTLYPNLIMPGKSLWLTITIVFSLFSVFILIGNSMICYIYYVTPSLRTNANKLMISCSTSAIFVALLFVPFYLVFDNMTNFVSSHGIPISSFLSSFLGFATLFNIGALTVERYVSIFHALRYELVMTNWRVNSMLFIVWFFPFFLSVLPFIIASSISDEEDIFDASKFYQGFLSILLLFIMAAIFIVYVRFWLASRLHLSFAKQQRDYVLSLRRASMSGPGLTSGANSGINSGDEEEENSEKLQPKSGTSNDYRLSGKTKLLPVLGCANACQNFAQEKCHEFPIAENNSLERKVISQRRSGCVYSTLVQFHDQRSNNNDSHSAETSQESSHSISPSSREVSYPISRSSQENSSINSPRSVYSPGSEYSPNIESPVSSSATTGYQQTEKKVSNISVPPKGFTEDLTRRLSTLSDNLKTVQKQRRVSVTINEKIVDESIYDCKPPMVRKISKRITSPRKLSVDWTPRKDNGARKFSVPSYLCHQKELLHKLKTGRRISYGSNFTNDVDQRFSSQHYKNGRRYSADLTTMRHISPIPSIDDREMSSYSESVSKESLHLLQTMEKEKSESTTSFLSCVSKFSDVQSPSLSAEASPAQTPGLQRSSTAQSRVFFSMNSTPVTPSSPCSSRKQTGQLKGIMRHSPVVSSMHKNKKSKRVHRTRTESGGTKKSLSEHKIPLRKTSSLPLNPASVLKAASLKQVEQQNSEVFKSSDSMQLHKNRCSFPTSLEDVGRLKELCESRSDTASLKRARYHTIRDRSFEKLEEELMVDNKKNIYDWKSKRKLFSLSASSNASFNRSRSFHRRSIITSWIKRQSSISMSISSRLSKRRSSYASIILYAKEFLQKIRCTRVIAYIFLINALCWVPLIFLNSVDAIGLRELVTYPLILISQIMFLINSLLMPFVYAYCQWDFKLALKRRVKNFFEKH